MAPAEYIFWISLALIAHTYVFYPFTLMAFALLKRRRERAAYGEGATPSVSVVVSVFNEESLIRRRIENLLEQDYPADTLEILIGSDGSTDRTNQILAEMGSTRVRTLFYPQRRGKAGVLNDLIAQATGEVVVLTDANTFFDKETVKRLIERMADPTVGSVCGRLVLQSDFATIGGAGESSYWSYENGVKELEGIVYSAVGATGAVYAVRRDLIQPLPTNKVIMDDFLIPLYAVRKGFRTVYEPTAVAREKLSGSIAGEFKRKIRISAANFNGISEIADLLLPQKGFIAYALWSHKIIRWCVPFLLLLLGISSVALSGYGGIYVLTMAAGILLAAAALIGFVAEATGKRLPGADLAAYFIAANTGLLIGFFKFLFRLQKPAWEVVR